MKAIFFTEIGENVGYGHLSRCISLAFALNERDITSKFVICGKLNENISELHQFPCININWLENSSKISELMLEFDFGIFDSYKINTEILSIINKSPIFPIFLDDMNLIKYPRGLVINSAFSASELNYPEENSIKYLLGPCYLMLKKEFWESPNREVKNDPEIVLITWGANDLRNLSPKIIELVQNLQPNLKINLIATSFFQNLSSIIKYTNSKCNIIQNPSTTQIKELMINSDFAITAGGQTCLELISMQVPSIIIVTAENQLKNAESMSEKSTALLAGKWNDPGLMEIFRKKFADIQNLEVRKNLINNGKTHIIAPGSRKIVETLIKISTFKENKIKQNQG